MNKEPTQNWSAPDIIPSPALTAALARLLRAVAEREAAGVKSTLQPAESQPTYAKLRR